MSSGFGRSLPVNSLNGSSSSVSLKPSQNIPPGSASRAILAPPVTNTPVSFAAGLTAASSSSFSSSFSGISSSSSSSSLSASVLLSSSALGSSRSSLQNPLAERPASTGNTMPAFKIPKLKVQSSNTTTNSQMYQQAQTVPAAHTSSLLLSQQHQATSSSQPSITSVPMRSTYSSSGANTTMTATALINDDLASSVVSVPRAASTRSTFPNTSSSSSSSSLSSSLSTTTPSLHAPKLIQQAHAKPNYRSAQPSFMIAEDEDGALSAASSPVQQSFDLSSSSIYPTSTSVDDTPLELEELSVVSAPAPLHTAVVDKAPMQSSIISGSSSSISSSLLSTKHASTAVTYSGPTMTTTTTTNRPTPSLPAFQLPSRSSTKTGSSSVTGAASSSSGSSNNNTSSAAVIARRRRKSGANTTVLSVSDPTGTADVLEHPSLPVSDSEDEEQDMKSNASKKRKASSSSFSNSSALTTSIEVNASIVLSSERDHHNMVVDPQPSTTSSRGRRKSSISNNNNNNSASSTGGGGGGGVTDNKSNSVATTDDIMVSSASVAGSRKRSRGSSKQIAQQPDLIESSSFSETMHDVESTSLSGSLNNVPQPSLPALARLNRSTTTMSSNSASEAANTSSKRLTSAVPSEIGTLPPPRSLSSSSSSLFRVRRGGCGSNLVTSTFESDSAFALRLGLHVAAILEGVAAFTSARCSSVTLPQLSKEVLALSDEFENSVTSIGAAFSIPLRLIATAAASKTATMQTGGGQAGSNTSIEESRHTSKTTTTMMMNHFGSASSSTSSVHQYQSKNSSVLHEVAALKEFVNSLIAAEKLCSPEISAINERNIQRNNHLNAGREEKIDALLMRSNDDDGEDGQIEQAQTTDRPALSATFLSQQSQSMDEDDAYTGSASNSPIQVGSVRDSEGSLRFSSGGGVGFGSTSQRVMLPPPPPPCTPLRQVLSTNVAASSGDSLTPERQHKKNHTVRFSSFDFSALNAAPAELTSSAIPAPFSSRRSPQSIAMGGSAADDQQQSADGKGGAGGGCKRDIIESGCLVFSLTEVLSAAKKLRDVLHHLPVSISPSSSSSSSSSSPLFERNSSEGGGLNTSSGDLVDSEKRIYNVGSPSSGLNFEAEIRAITIPHAVISSKNGQEIAPPSSTSSSSSSSSSFSPASNTRSYVSLTAPLMQMMCALSTCSSAKQWDAVIGKAFEKCYSSSSSSSFSGSASATSSTSVHPLPHYSHDVPWSTIRGAARFHAKEISQLRSEILELPLSGSLSNALSSSARYHLRRALNPHVYDDDGETIVNTGVRPFDPTSTPPPPSSSSSSSSSVNPNPQKLLLLDGINHHHHHRSQLVLPVSKPVVTTRSSPPPLCGGLGRGAGGIKGGFLSMANGSGNFKYNSDDLAAATHEALRSLYLSRERVEAIIAPHSLLVTGEDADWEDSNTPMAQPLSLIQIVDACSLSDLGCVYRFAESHAFLRSLFGHEQAIAALATDGECWKKLRTLARIADEFDCETERHLLPLASISTTALTSLLQEGETVDKLLSFSQLTLDRHVRGLEAARPKPKRSSTGSTTGGGIGGGGGGGSAPASPSGGSGSAAAALVSSTSSHHDDHCSSTAGRNGLAARDAHDRPRKKRHAHSRLASPSPLDRQRFLELVVGSGSVEDDEDCHYPDPVPPMKLDLLMHAEADTITSSSSSLSSSLMLDNDSIDGGGGGAVSDVLNTSNGCDTESSGGSGGGMTSLNHHSTFLTAGHGHGGGGISSRFALLGSDAAASRAQCLLDHEDIIDKKLRFLFPKIKFFRCSADARHVFDDEANQNWGEPRGGGGLISSSSQFLSGLGGSFTTTATTSLNNNNNSSSLSLQSSSSSLQHAQKSQSNVVNLNFRLSAAPVVVKTSVPSGGGGDGGGSSAQPPSLTLDDLMADVMRFPGGSSALSTHESSPQAQNSINGSSLSSSSLAASSAMTGAPHLQLFSSFQGGVGGFAPSPFSAAFSTLSLLAPLSSSSLSSSLSSLGQNNNILMENYSSSSSSFCAQSEGAVISSDCGECKKSLLSAPSAMVDAQWGAGASPGAKRRERMAQASSSGGGLRDVITVKCGKCKVSFHADCVGLSIALERWNCQSCMWK